ncbi:F-box protein At1g47056-like [Zingiber officinale]|uniref:F-box protein At1g47056-like n=1 Tax=Zingiber officinale TaxID=94328 RepID=UPI001C4AE8DE|nr:F-box protein At1g47056-like [Zingiber officinale]
MGTRTNHRRQTDRIYPPPPSSSCTGQVVSSHSFILSHSRDVTTTLPDECLALVFHFLDATDRRICSLVCRRWLLADGCFCTRLSLQAPTSLLQAAPALFSCFEAISNLILCSSRHSASIDDDTLELIASRCTNLLSLKLQACYDLTDAGMAAVSRHCLGLRKLLVVSCCFGAKGINVVL